VPARCVFSTISRGNRENTPKITPGALLEPWLLITDDPHTETGIPEGFGALHRNTGIPGGLVSETRAHFPCEEEK
jgi:hypothetical protein